MAACVLIVEDQMLIAWHLRELVEAAGHRVLALARDPTEAMAAAAQERPDFAMVDLRLHADTSGLDAARMLYERWGVRSIFVSANIDGEFRARAACYQPLGFIGKPFIAAEVTAALEHAALQTAPSSAERESGQVSQPS